MPVILQDRRPGRATTHGPTHVSTGHVVEGGASIVCTMTRGGRRWTGHINPKAYRLMRALQQQQLEADHDAEPAQAQQQQQQEQQ